MSWFLPRPPPEEGTTAGVVTPAPWGAMGSGLSTRPGEAVPASILSEWRTKGVGRGWICAYPLVGSERDDDCLPVMAAMKLLMATVEEPSEGGRCYR